MIQILCIPLWIQTGGLLPPYYYISNQGQNDVERWKKAYNEITTDLPRINACGYGLVNESNVGTNASGWASVFSMVDGNTEAVFVTLYNNKATGGVPDFSKNNSQKKEFYHHLPLYLMVVYHAPMNYSY